MQQVDEEIRITGGSVELPGTDVRLAFMDIHGQGLPRRLWMNRATRRHIERYQHRHPSRWEQC